MYWSLSRVRYAVFPVLMTIVLCYGTSVQGRDLSDILQQVERNTPALQAAQARSEKQKAAVKQARSRYFGEVDALVKNSNYDSGRLINPISYPVNLQPQLFDDNQIGYGVNVRLPVDINGRITAKVDGADKQLKVALASEGNVRLQVLHGAADLYHSLEGVKALEQALEKQVEALTAHIKVAAVSIAAGRTAPVEKLRLVADQETVKAKLATLKGQEQGIRARLSALMGTAFFPDPVTPVSNPPTPSVQAAGDIANRPDIQALLFSGKAADAEVRAAFATRLPELNLNGAWMQNQGFSGDGDDTWALFVQLQLPLWDGGGRRAAVAEAKSNRTVIHHELEDLKNRARAEVVAAQADWHAAEISYRATIASIEAARETARIQSDRFAEGRLSAADLVDAESSLAAARSERALALTNWWQAGDHLRRAVGMDPSAYIKAAASP